MGRAIGGSRRSGGTVGPAGIIAVMDRSYSPERWPLAIALPDDFLDLRRYGRIPSVRLQTVYAATVLGKAAAAAEAAAHSELIKQKWQIRFLWGLPGFSFASVCCRFLVNVLKCDCCCCCFFSYD